MVLNGEGVQCLMEFCLAAGSVAEVLTSQVRETVGQRKADELRLKGALAKMKSFVRAVKEEEWYVTIKDRKSRIFGNILSSVIPTNLRCA